MTEIACERELETLAAMSDGTWPDRCGEDLRAHVAACPSCAEMTVVAGALLDDRTEAFSRAALPSSGLMWWRMQFRSRQERARAATITVAIIQAAAFVAVLAIAIVGMAVFSPSTSHSLNPFTDFASFQAIFKTAVASAVQWGVPLIFAFAAWVTLAPVIVWMAVTED